jgi:hypothetical protein
MALENVELPQAIQRGGKQDTMEEPEFAFSVMTILAKEPDTRSDIFGDRPLPEQIRDYRRGRTDLMAMVTLKTSDEKERWPIVGAAGATVLEHADKAPLVYVLNVSVDPLFQGKNLERGLLNVLTHHARENGFEGLGFAEGVQALIASLRGH